MAEDTVILVVLEEDEVVVILYPVMMPLGVWGEDHVNITWVEETGHPLNEATGPGAERQDGK